MSFLSCACCLTLHHAARHKTILYTSGLCWLGQYCLFMHMQVVRHILMIIGTAHYGWCVCFQQQHAVLHPCSFGTSCSVAVPAEDCLHLQPSSFSQHLCNIVTNDCQGMGSWDPLLGTRDGHLGPLGTGRLAPQAGCCGSPLLSCWETASPPSPCFSSPP